jgi:hypothetical protein
MKIGDKVKGFKFTAFNNSAILNYNRDMNRFVGVEGVVSDVGTETFSIFYEGVGYWSYPIQEYLAIQRERRLKELGI